MSSAASSLSDVPATPAPRSAARPYLIFGAFVVASVAAYAGLRMWTAGSENTDDAQVAADIVPVSTRVAGLVAHVHVTDNQLVKAGELIAEIDAADYSAKVKQAEAEVAAANADAEAASARVAIVTASSKGNLSSARAALTGTTVSLRGADSQIEAAQAAVNRATFDLQKSNVDLERAKSLRKDDAIPAAQVDSLIADANASQAALELAKAQLNVALDSKHGAQARIGEAEGRLEQSVSVDAQLKAAQASADLASAHVQASAAALELAKLQLSYTKIYAATDGHVSKLAVHQGQIVQASQLITSLVPSSTYLLANFKETQVGAMHAGQPAEVTVDALPGRKLRAVVQSVAAGTGAQFSMLPPDNASGNFVKVVQRVPVKLAWTDLPQDLQLQAGLSLDVTVSVK